MCSYCYEFEKASRTGFLCTSHLNGLGHEIDLNKCDFKNLHFWAELKVHKRENFFGSDFEFYTFL
jgi:hypothetical protein